MKSTFEYVESHLIKHSLKFIPLKSFNDLIREIKPIYCGPNLLKKYAKIISNIFYLKGRKFCGILIFLMTEMFFSQEFNFVKISSFKVFDLGFQRVA